MASHVWVMLTYTPLEITQQPDGSLHVEATEAAIEAAADEGKMGCWFCFTPLQVETFNTECSFDHEHEKIAPTEP